MSHLVDLYQVCSNYAHGAKNGPALGVTCFTKACVRKNIVPDKDWKQLGIYPPLLGLIGYFKLGISSFLYWVSIWKQISNETGPTLVSPDFFWLTFGFTFRNPLPILLWYTWDRYFRHLSKIKRIYQVIYDSSNLQRGIKVELLLHETILFYCFFAIVIVKWDECRYCVNIGYH